MTVPRPIVGLLLLGALIGGVMLGQRLFAILVGG